MILYYVVALLAGALAGASPILREAGLHFAMRARSMSASGYAPSKPGHVDSGLADGRKWTILDVICCGGLVAFSGLRSGVGTDYPLYESLYGALEPGHWRQQLFHTQQDVGFAALSLFLHQITTSIHPLMWVAAVVTVVPVYAVIKNRSTRPGLAVLLYIFLGSYLAPFNAVRQGMAVTLNFVSIESLNPKKWKTFLLLNITASLIHKSVLIVVVIELAIVAAIRIRPRLIPLLLAVGLGALAASLALSTSLLTTALTNLNGRYSLYLNPDVPLSQVQATRIGVYLQIVFWVGILMYLVRLFRKHNVIGGAETLYFNYLIVGVIILIISAKSVVIARLSLYFTIYAILLLPNLLAREKRHSIQPLVVGAFAAIYFAFYITHYDDLLPYTTYL